MKRKERRSIQIEKNKGKKGRAAASPAYEDEQ